MQKYRDNVTIQGRGGLVPVRNANVTVYNNGTNDKAVIYTNAQKTPQSNPFITDALGGVSFYAENGRYDLAIQGDGQSLRLNDILMQDVLQDVEGLEIDMVAVQGVAADAQVKADAAVPRVELEDAEDDDKGAALSGYSGRNVYLRLKDRRSINDYAKLAIGGDWAPAINALVTEAAGKPCYLERGGVYEIQSQIAYAGDLRLYCEGSVPATIFQNGQAFDLMVIGGAPSPVLTTSLTAPMQRGNHVWNVASTAGVLPGMLMTVKSAYSWYYDPRPGSSDARKSELHRVAKVLSATQLVCEDVAQDGYDAPTEAVQIIFESPALIDFKGVGVRGVQPSPSPSAPTRVGIRAYRTSNAIFEEVDTVDTTSIGLWISGGYKPEVIGGESRGINASTGYGVQTYGTSWATIRGRNFYECNKSADISGGNIVSRNSVVEKCFVSGGGYDYEGTGYGYDDNGVTIGNSQYGMGTHGPACDAIFRDNVFRDIYCPFSAHGTNVFIERNRAYGRIPIFAQINGGNYFIRDNFVLDGWYPDGDGTPYSYTGAFGINQFRNRRFIRVAGAEALNGLSGDLIVTGNRAQISEHLVSFQETVVNFPKRLLVKGNEICLATTTQTEPTAAIMGGEFSPIPTLSNVRILDNDVVRDNGQTGSIPSTYKMNLDATCQVENGGVYEGIYVPTVTGNVNVSSTFISGDFWNYQRIGNQVRVWGSVSITPAATGTCSILITVPFPSSATSVWRASGAAVFNNTSVGSTEKESASVRWTSSGGGRLSMITNPTNTNTKVYTVEVNYGLNQAGL